MKTEPGRWIFDGRSSHVKGLRIPKNTWFTNIVPFTSHGSKVSRAEQVLGHQGINYWEDQSWPLRFEHGQEKQPSSQTLHLGESILINWGEQGSSTGWQKHSNFFQRPTASGSQRRHFKLVWRAPAGWFPEGVSGESDPCKSPGHTLPENLNQLNSS